MTVHNVLACILVAATATATANPGPAGYDERVPYGVRHERVGPREWVQLASATPTRFGTEYFILPRDTGWVRTLRIDALSGTVVVRRIDYVSRDHVARTIVVDRRLDRFHPTAYVDLGVPRRLEQLVVTTNRRPAGTYAIYGSPAPLPVIREVATR